MTFLGEGIGTAGVYRTRGTGTGSNPLIGTAVGEYG